MLDGLVLAPSDRSAIWFGKALAALAFLALAEVIALPLFALFFSGMDAATVAAVALADIGICAVGVFVAAMAIATPGPRAAAAGALPAARDSGDRRRRRRERDGLAGALLRVSRALRRPLCDNLLGLF